MKYIDCCMHYLPEVFIDTLQIKTLSPRGASQHCEFYFKVTFRGIGYLIGK